MDYIATIGSVVAALVTAGATVFLWIATRTLVAETRRMVEASSSPHVVATLEPNRWSLMYADIHVSNNGTGTAYDVAVVFEPALSRADGPVPLQHISVLRPGQSMVCYLSEFKPLLDKVFTVTTSWQRDPQKDARETNTYVLNMKGLEGTGTLGAADPLIQIAEELKHIREDWKSVASGFKRLNVDTFGSQDREREAEERAAQMRERQAARRSQQPATSSSTTAARNDHQAGS